jgi:ABC-2 type transport system ATP-binding protein
MITTDQAEGPALRTLLTAHGLRKSYGPRPALRGLSFTLGAGRILGFLGPNGAGKTTAIRILTTSLEPSAGHFFVDGIRSDQPDRIRHRIGVLPESLGFPKHMTGLEYLAFFGQLYGLRPADSEARAVDLLSDVGLQQRGRSRIGSYSHGMRQRLGIARALINEPVVMFLDEPTLGLDPRGQQELLALIRRIARDRGASIVLCSHLLSEIEGICDDVVILNLGQVVASGTVSEVLEQAGSEVIHVRVAPDAIEAAKRAIERVRGVARVVLTDELAGRIGVQLADPASGRARDEPAIRMRVLAALVRAKVPIVSLGGTGNRLQELFLQVTDEAIS